MNEFLLIMGMVAVTFSVRFVPILLLGRLDFPKRFFDLLKYVPPAVLTAIVAPALLMPGGQIEIGFGNVRLIAGLLAVLAAWRTRNLLLTIAVGMVSLWLLQWLL